MRSTNSMRLASNKKSLDDYDLVVMEHLQQEKTQAIKRFKETGYRDPEQMDFIKVKHNADRTIESS